MTRLLRGVCVWSCVSRCLGLVGVRMFALCQFSWRECAYPRALVLVRGYSFQYAGGLLGFVVVSLMPPGSWFVAVIFG